MHGVVPAQALTGWVIIICPEMVFICGVPFSPIEVQ